MAGVKRTNDAPIPEAKKVKLNEVKDDTTNSINEESSSVDKSTKNVRTKAAPTTINSQIVAEEPTPPVRDLPKRKFALYIGFCGIGYQGMQM